MNNLMIPLSLGGEPNDNTGISQGARNQSTQMCIKVATLSLTIN